MERREFVLFAYVDREPTVRHSRCTPRNQTDLRATKEKRIYSFIMTVQYTSIFRIFYGTVLSVLYGSVHTALLLDVNNWTNFVFCICVRGSFIRIQIQRINARSRAYNTNSLRRSVIWFETFRRSLWTASSARCNGRLAIRRCRDL